MVERPLKIELDEPTAARLETAAAAASPLNMLYATVDPASAIGESLGDPAGARVALVVGTLVATAVYGLACFGMHAAMKKSFMMVVRRLAGTG